MCETPTPGNAPKYLKNSATRVDGTVDEFAYTRVDGRRISLGRYGHAEGYQRWKRLLNYGWPPTTSTKPSNPHG